jgi:Ribonuclease G/E
VNLEAAEEVVRQIRMRDLSGIIAIDFIDLKNQSNIHNLEKRVNELFKQDLALVRMSKINEFGVMMISRQRAGVSLYDLFHTRCSSCNHLTEPRVESLAFNLLSELRVAVYCNPYENIQVKCSKQIAYYVLNYMKSQVAALEKNNVGQITISEATPLDLKAEQKIYFTVYPKGILKWSDLIQLEEVANYNLYDHQYLVLPSKYESFIHWGQICLIQN